MLKPILVNNKKLELNILSDADESVFNEIFVDREYKILDPIIKNAKNLILDIGAHIGFFSIYSRTLNSRAPILAFEPDERNFALLKKNLKLNHIKDIIVKQAAVSNAIQKQPLYLSMDSHNHSLVKDAKVDINKTKIVDTTILNKILEKINICDLVKMDCEGAEFAILKSVDKNTFAKIKTFYIEFHEYNEAFKREILADILRKNHFNVKTFYSHYDRRMGGILAVRN